MTITIPDKWSQPNELWHQKTAYTQSGKPNITYHFKCQAQPPSKVFEINTNLTKQLCGYELLKKDLTDIAAFYEDIKEILANEVLRGRTSLQKSIVRAIAVTYGKCFAEATGRKIKLERCILPEEFIELHNYLINMRNNYVAHAGESEHEYCKYVLVIPPFESCEYGQDVQYAAFVETNQTVNSEIILKENFRCLIKKLLEYVNNKIILLEGRVLAELKENLKSNPSRLYHIEPEKNRSVYPV